MNIFKALCNGKGSINEENTSSFLGYLLNPYEDHGMKDEFVKRFLKEINISDDIRYTDLQDYDVSFEVPVRDKTTRNIDIIFRTTNHIVAIENKIKKDSCQETQLQEEYNGLQNYINDENLKNKKILLCFLTPNIDKKEVKKYQKNIPNENFNHIEWESIAKILESILNDENTAKINPISDYVKHTIKAFINFIRSFLYDQIKGKSIEFELQERRYVISEYKSSTITVEQIVKKDNGSITYESVSAREIIRRKLDEYKNIDNKYSYLQTGKDKRNTRTVGAWLISELKKEK